MIWDEVSRRVPGVKGVWIVEEGLLWVLVISVEQQYVGHAREAALAARSAHFLFKFVMRTYFQPCPVVAVTTVRSHN